MSRLFQRSWQRLVHPPLIILIAVFASLSVIPQQAAAALTSGNLVVLRLGDGGSPLTSAATPVFLDEFTAAGAQVQTLPMPTAVGGSNRILTNSGSASSEGALNRSADGRYLTLAGYDAPAGTASVVSTASASTNRIIARVDANGVVDTSTRIGDGYTGNNIRGVVTDDGTRFWTGGTASGTAGGVRFVPFGNAPVTPTIQISSAPTNVRVPSILGGQLYVSSGSSPFIGVSSIGSGLPTTAGQTTTLLSGLPGTGNPYAYVLLDRDAGVPGADTLYVADQTAANGLLKYSFDGATWTARGSLPGVLTGLTGTLSGSNATLFATSGTGAGNTLVSVTDIAPFNAPIAGAYTTLATASANTVFRGVAFAPEGGTVATSPSITTQPASQAITSGATATLNIVATGAAPLAYQWYQGSTGDTSTPVGTNAPSFTTPALNATTSYWVRVSNSAGSADSTTAMITVTAALPACSATDTPIHAVQGSGNTAAITGTVTVQGVVVGDYEGPAPTLRGFYLQDLNPDADPATSEGIFVFEGSNADSVSLGQVVQVTGTAAEFQDQTQINATTIESCGTTASVTPTDLTMPFPAAVNSVPYLERYEGMLVRFPQQLYVTEHFQLGRFGQVVVSSGSRLPQPTNIVLPGAPAQAQQAANDLNELIVDDENQAQNPDPIEFGRGGSPLSASNTLRGGDSATSMLGVMSYTWAGNVASGNAYRLRPIGALGGGVPNFQPSNPRPAGPPNVGGQLKVASFNVLNYFLTLDIGTQANCGPIGFKQECRGAETAEELGRQQQKLNQALLKLDADIVGMMELENSQNAQGQDVNPVADIVGRLNSSLGADVYGSIDTGVIGTDTIRVGIIYKKASVTPIGAALIDTNPIHNRPPVAQLFRENANGERFSVIVNHFKSKSSCPAAGDPNADQGDGQSCWNTQRVQQAQALLSFISGTVIPTTGDQDVLLIGDFNSYAKEDPIRTLEQAGFTNLVARFAGAEAYSYAFDGQWGYLDQGLASASMLGQVNGASDYHINADEPSVLDYNTNFKSAGQVSSLFGADEFRTSDHDPVVIGLTPHPFPQANPDSYTAEAGATLTIGAGQGILSNDANGPLQIITHTAPTNGTLALNPDGSFSYTPTAGFAGTDSFSYTVSNAVQLYRTNLPPLATAGGVNITAGAYGSAIYPVPGSTDEFYGLTDRGPNVDGPNGTKVEPIPTFDPAIGKFKLVNGQAILEQAIPLKAADGTPFSGRVNTQANTGEVITDLNGNALPPDPNGNDSEGLVALPDGSFWVSDEYGPFIAHFDASGKEIERLSPFNGKLPAELATRIVNRGMEGLTITPDGSTLVGIMQSALQQGDLAGFDGKKLTPLRIVTYRLATGETHEYLYLLDNPSTTKTAVSEITALSNTTFLVDERDGNYLPAAYKKLYKIDISSATDVGPLSSVSGAVYNSSGGGLLVDGKTIELLVKGQDTAASAATLTSKGITPAAKSLYLDIGALLTSLDPQARFFAHDKLEGVAVTDAGRKLVISNDSDFGIDGLSNTTAPFQLHAKITPAGQQDEGEFLVVDLGRVPAALSSATVTIKTADTITPTTSASVSGVVQPGCPAGCYYRSASITLSAADTGLGVASTTYRVNNGPAQTYSEPFSITTEGNNTVTFFSTDKAGNIETTHSLNVQVTAFDRSLLLDNFNRANGLLGRDWFGDLGNFFIRNNQAQILLSGTALWDKAAFGSTQEAFVTLSAIAPHGLRQGLLLKVQDSLLKPGAISVAYNAQTKTVLVESFSLKSGWSTVGSFPATLANGDQLGARALADGSVRVYVNCKLLGTANGGSFFAGKGGRIGLWSVVADGGTLDDFGGGSSAP